MGISLATIVPDKRRRVGTGLDRGRRQSYYIHTFTDVYMRRTFAEAQLTKQALLDAGAVVFARVGFSRASLGVIGKEARLTRGAVYWHFHDKLDLFRQIVRRENERLDGLIESVLAVPASPFQKLARLLDSVIDNFYDNPGFRRFIEMTWYRLDADPFKQVMKRKTAFVQNFLGRMESLLAEAAKSGEIRGDTDVSLAAFHLSCLINGFYRLYHVAPQQARDKAKTKRLFRNHLDSLASDSRKE